MMPPVVHPELPALAFSLQAYEASLSPGVLFLERMAQQGDARSAAAAEHARGMGTLLSLLKRLDGMTGY